MSARRCWTCGNEHDMDEPCKQSPLARAQRAAGGTLFGQGQSDDSEIARPTINAKYDGYCSAGDDISEGEPIRADGEGGWIHIECEDMA